MALMLDLVSGTDAMHDPVLIVNVFDYFYPTETMSKKEISDLLSVMLVDFNDHPSARL